MQLAVIGLGAMGAPMARNLLKAGHSVTVFNRTAAKAVDFEKLGARCAGSPRAAAVGCEILLVNVSDTPDVEEVLLHPETGAALGLAQGSLVIDCSSIAPGTTRSIAAKLALQGVGYVDAPVSGGPEGAEKATLAIMCGGSETDFARALPILNLLGARVVRVGPVGCGQVAKAVNQVVIAGTYQALAEGLVLAASAGADPAQVLQAISAGAARSWVLENRAGNMLRDQYPPGFRLALHRKDLRIALGEAQAAGAHLPLTQLVAAAEDRLLQSGHGAEDMSVLARQVREDAHIPPGPFPSTQT
ncbi:MAG: NAD(P)-dependent oxidoreductase [Planctomycetes bacterium]|nr:NAD(P)-dependent oxidoreductase [Planctomycetota bacterium]